MTPPRAHRLALLSCLALLRPDMSLPMPSPPPRASSDEESASTSSEAEGLVVFVCGKQINCPWEFPFGLRNMVANTVNIDVSVLGWLEYDGLRKPGPFAPAAYEYQALQEMKTEVRSMMATLRKAKKIRNVNISLSREAYLTPEQRFDRLVQFLSFLADMKNIENVEIMPFWPKDYFKDHPEEMQRAKEAKETVGDKGEVQGFIVMDRGHRHYQSEEHRRCEAVFMKEKNCNWRFPYVLRDCLDSSTMIEPLDQ